MKRPSFLPTPEQRAAARKKRDEQRLVTAEANALHQQRLNRLAGVSSTVLRCHQDVWWELRRIGKRRTDTNLPHDESTTTKLDEGLVEVRLSGPNLVWILDVTRSYAGSSPSPTTQAIMTRLYHALVALADQVDPAAPGRPVPPIVLDDKAVDDPAT